MTFVKVVARLAVLLGFCLTVVAIGLARLVPTAGGKASQAARPARAQYLGINDYSANGELRCRLLDRETGRIVPLALPGTDTLLFARSSPWEDDEGRLQVVGRWLARDADGIEGTAREVGVARCTFPGGEVIDRVVLDVVPASAPCWFPGTAPRILYGGTDGRLYRLDFDDDDGADGDDGPGRRMQPEPITWACARPGDGEVRIAEPAWPADARLGGRLLVSLTYIHCVDGNPTFTPSQIWWLKLGADGRSIKAAGPLTAHRARPGTPTQERFPSVTDTPDRGLVLAYLARDAGDTVWSLKVAPVTVDEATGVPRARTRGGACLARDVAVSPPLFSADGRSVLTVRSPAQVHTLAERFAVADALPARGARHLAARPDVGRGLTRRWHPLDLGRTPRSDRLHGKS